MNGAASLVLGPTGLVGRSLSTLLREAGGPLTLLTRRPTGLAGAAVVERLVDFSRLDDVAEHLKADDLYCCLGTTLRKAGSPEAFRAVDLDLPLALCARAAARGVSRLFLVTSSGADAGSRFLYSRVKGELEEAVAKLPFKAVHIARPSLLLGERGESRPAEGLAQAVLPFLSPLIPARYRPIRATTVAKALVALSKTSEAGVHFHESDALASLGA
ncbi:MAG: NAD-dependent epimerase/dehydratase [Elusimicrobia bacterium]|nr:MAG: NAD-dependent epimerase/dehydratase [Elusimicrobiota bacterium]